MALINILKKVEKARDNLGLPGDEQVTAACTINPKGTMKRGVASGIGGVVGGAIAARGSTAEETTGGLAERFVVGQNALTLTDRRMMLVKLSAMTGKPKEIVAEWTRSDVASIVVEDGKLAHPMTISFTDGTNVTVEGAKGTNPQSLAF